MKRRQNCLTGVHFCPFTPNSYGYLPVNELESEADQSIFPFEPLLLPVFSCRISTVAAAFD